MARKKAKTNMAGTDTVVGAFKNFFRMIFVVYAVGSSATPGGGPLFMAGAAFGAGIFLAVIEYGAHQLMKSKKTFDEVGKSWLIAIVSAIVLAGLLSLVYTSPPGAPSGWAAPGEMNDLELGGFSISIPQDMYRDEAIAKANNAKLGYISQSNVLLVLPSQKNTNNVTVETVADAMATGMAGEFDAKYHMEGNAAILVYNEQTSKGSINATMKLIECNDTFYLVDVLSLLKDDSMAGRILGTMRCT